MTLDFNPFRDVWQAGPPVSPLLKSWEGHVPPPPFSLKLIGSIRRSLIQVGPPVPPPPLLKSWEGHVPPPPSADPPWHVILSSYSQGLDYDILDCVEKEMMLYMSQGDVLLCGDLNARTSCENDFILRDSSKFIPMYSNYVSDRDILPRISQDKMLDNRGKNLIDFCISNQIRILNGRAFGDCFGRYTCFTPNGASTVDYVLASGHLLDQILYLHIADFDPTLSYCHCLLEWKISAKFKIINEVGNVSIHPVSPNFTWDEESAPKYLNALYSSDIKRS